MGTQLPLLPHQISAVRKIVNPRSRGQLLFHGVGTGKSLTSIAALAAMKKPTTIVVPAAIVNNYKQELQKWLGRVPDNVRIVSQQKVTRDGIAPYDNPVLVVDESHRARAEGSQLLQALKKTKAEKRILLSGTPQVNAPRDIAPLINLIQGRTVLPEKERDFNERFIENKRMEPSFFGRMMGVQGADIPQLKNVEELKAALKPVVDYHEGTQEGFPSTKEELIKVPMASSQTDIYKAILGKAPWWVRWKVKAGLPPGKGELEKMRAFLSGARQVSNSTADFIRNPLKADAPKIQTAFNFFQKKLATNPNYKAVVYANFLRGGLGPYRQLLQKNKIPFGEFTGEMPDKIRQDMIKQYNENKIKALLISQAAGEGLSLKGTRLVQLLHPEFNTAREKQIIARGIRYQSHAHLPPNERNVLVQRYLAEPGGSWLDRLLGRSTLRGADEYIYNLARQKEKLTDNLTQVIKGL